MTSLPDAAAPFNSAAVPSPDGTPAGGDPVNPAAAPLDYVI
jgi:hypothetical protein